MAYPAEIQVPWGSLVAHIFTAEHTIVYLIIAAFLASTLLLCFKAGRGIRDIQDYAMGKRAFSTIALVLTYLATEIGGGSVWGNVKEVCTHGVIVTIALAGLMITHLVRAYLFAPCMVHFQHAMTMGDVVTSLYGKLAGVIAGILSVLYALAVVGLQLTTLGMIFESLLGIQAIGAIFIASLGLAAYSAYGGIRAVIATDVLQFLVVLIIFPLIAFLLLHKAGGLEAVLSQVPADRWHVWGHPKDSFYLSLFLMWALFSIEMIDPAIMQRMLMAQAGSQLRDQFLVVAGADFAFRLVIMLIGLAALVAYPSIEANQVLPHIIQELLPVGLKGLAIAGGLAITMSTADSYLHVGGLALAHDVLRPLLGPSKGANQTLSWARYSTVSLGLLAPLIALQKLSLSGFNFIVLSITGPLLGIPLIAGILGLKPDQRAFYGAMGVALVVFLTCKLWLPAEKAHLGTLWSIVANGSAFLALHRLQNKGWALAARSQGPAKELKAYTTSFLVRLRQYFPTPQRILHYSQSKVSQYGAPYSLFGVFFIINALVPIFLWGYMDGQAQGAMLTIRFIGACLCVLLIVREKWPQYLLPYLPIFWHLTVLYCLPFSSTMMCLLSQGSTAGLINIASLIILLFVLVDWLSALVIGMLGVGLGCLACSYWVGKVALALPTQYLLVYQVVFGVLIGLIFARRQAFSLDWPWLRKEHGATRQQATHRELIQTLHCREELLKELNPDEVRLFTNTDSSTSAYTRQAIYRVRDYLCLDVSKLSLDQLLQEARSMIELKGLEYQLKLVKRTKHEVLQADGAKLKQLLVNSISYVHKHSLANPPITIGLEDATLGHSIAHIPGYTRKLAALKLTITTEQALPATQELYMLEPTKVSLVAPQNEAELLLVDNARIIDVHYGYIDIAQPTTHVYVIPVQLKKVRDKVMERLRASAVVDPEELSHPIAIRLEQELFDKLQGTKVDLAVIHQALDVIKKYHGGVRSNSGEPFFAHLIAVALILLEHSQDQDAVVAALLHDTVVETDFSLAHVRVHFGEIVAYLVKQATQLIDDIRRISLQFYEHLPRLGRYKDPRAALVKLSDRLHSMRIISEHPLIKKQKVIAHETLIFFVPLAENLELTSIAQELEQIAFEVLRQPG